MDENEREVGLARSNARTEAWLLKRRAGLETDAITKEKIGRDPRAMSRTELEALGHKPMSIIDALRARCIDCCAGSPVEVRKCVSVECPSWPFRMGSSPWRERRVYSDEERARLGDRLTAARTAARKARQER